MAETEIPQDVREAVSLLRLHARKHKLPPNDNNFEDAAILLERQALQLADRASRAPDRDVLVEAREAVAKAIYDVDPFYESGEYVDHFPVSPGGNLTWDQAKARDAEFANVPIMLPITKFAYDAADAALSAIEAAQ